MGERKTIAIAIIPQRHNSGWTAETTMSGDGSTPLVIVGDGATATMALENLSLSLRSKGL